METILGIIIGLSVSLFMETIKNVTKVIRRIDKGTYREIYRYFLYRQKKTRDSVYRELIDNCNSNIYPIYLKEPNIKENFKYKNKIAKEFIKLEQKASKGNDGILERYHNLVYEADNATSIISAYQTMGAVSAVLIMFSFIMSLYWDFYIEGNVNLYIVNPAIAEAITFIALTVVFLFKALRSPDTEPDCLEKKDIAIPVCLFYLFCMMAGIVVTTALNTMWYLSKDGSLQAVLAYRMYFFVISLLMLAALISYILICGPLFKKLHAITVLLKL